MGVFSIRRNTMSQTIYTWGRYTASEILVGGELTGEYQKGAYIDDVSSLSAGTYPDDGLHTDGFWYVKVSA